MAKCIHFFLQVSSSAAVRSPSFKGLAPDSVPAKVITRANSYAAEPRATARSGERNGGGGDGGDSQSPPPSSGRAQVQKLMAKPRSQQSRSPQPPTQQQQQQQQGGSHIQWRDGAAAQ